MKKAGGFRGCENWGNSSPRCPYCHKSCEPQEYNRYDHAINQIKCEHCEKKFICQTREAIEYDTVGDCEANGQMPHKLKLCWPHELGRYECQNCNGDWYDWQLANGRYARLKSEDYTIVEKEDGI